MSLASQTPTCLSTGEPEVARTRHPRTSKTAHVPQSFLLELRYAHDI